MDEWDTTPDGMVQVAMFSGWAVALAPPHAAAVRILYFRDPEAAQAGNREAFQLGLTRVQLEELGNALIAAAKALDDANAASTEA